MRRLVILTALCSLSLGAFAFAAITPTLFPSFVVHTAALVVNGVPTPRYQVVHIADEYTEKTCVMVILDTETGQMTSTAVDPESCVVRKNPFAPSN